MTKQSINFPVFHRTIDIDGIEIFYREAGQQDAPNILLLHGYPSSSFQFRNFIPALADRWHFIAPDFPGLDYSATPDSFNNILQINYLYFGYVN
jgi:pimeloyl-ACP methyl ester carboxylesterase